MSSPDDLTDDELAELLRPSIDGLLKLAGEGKIPIIFEAPEGDQIPYILRGET